MVVDEFYISELHVTAKEPVFYLKRKFFNGKVY
jgi:hypothetical protein